MLSNHKIIYQANSPIIKNNSTQQVIQSTSNNFKFIKLLSNIKRRFPEIPTWIPKLWFQLCSTLISLQLTFRRTSFQWLLHSPISIEIRLVIASSILHKTIVYEDFEPSLLAGFLYTLEPLIESIPKQQMIQGSIITIVLIRYESS